jgi:hypothetical protein
VPKQHSTGGKTRLLGISKRGNAYLRRMFIHGARAVLLRVKYDTGALGQWMDQLQRRAARNASSLPLPTNWRASPGPCFPVANAIARGLQPWPHEAVEKIAVLGKR